MHWQHATWPLEISAFHFSINFCWIWHHRRIEGIIHQGSREVLVWILPASLTDMSNGSAPHGLSLLHHQCMPCPVLAQLTGTSRPGNIPATNKSRNTCSCCCNLRRTNSLWDHSTLTDDIHQLLGRLLQSIQICCNVDGHWHGERDDHASTGCLDRWSESHGRNSKLGCRRSIISRVIILNINILTQVFECQVVDS